MSDHAEGDFLKRNALQLADEHRMFCPGKSCTVTLTAIRLLLEKAGIELTDDDKRRLL